MGNYIHIPVDESMQSGKWRQNIIHVLASLTHEEICSSLVKPGNYEEIALPMSSVAIK